MENKEELNVTEAATEEVKAEETKEAVASEEKPARRRGRGRKQKIETTEEKPQRSTS